MEITRSSILMDCLEEMNRELHRYSKHGNGLLPLEGYEKHFDDLNEKCRLLRAMIIENQTREREAGREGVHTSKPLANWQKEIIIQDATGIHPGRDNMEIGPLEDPRDYQWNPLSQTWDKMMTPDEAVLRRRYRKAEGYKPEPVVYPGGEE